MFALEMSEVVTLISHKDQDTDTERLCLYIWIVAVSVVGASFEILF